MDDDTRNPWDQQLGEGNAPYRYLRTYLALGSRRSLPRLRTSLRKQNIRIDEQTLKGYSSAFKWQERADLWDKHVAAEAMKDLTAEASKAQAVQLKTHLGYAGFLFENMRRMRSRQRKEKDYRLAPRDAREMSRDTLAALEKLQPGGAAQMDADPARARQQLLEQIKATMPPKQQAVQESPEVRAHNDSIAAGNAASLRRAQPLSDGRWVQPDGEVTLTRSGEPAPVN